MNVWWAIGEVVIFLSEPELCILSASEMTDRRATNGKTEHKKIQVSDVKTAEDRVLNLISGATPFYANPVAALHKHKLLSLLTVMRLDPGEHLKSFTSNPLFENMDFHKLKSQTHEFRLPL